MTPVVMRNALEVAQTQWQQGLRALQRLNLAFLIHAQNYCVFRRVEIQPHDIPNLLDEKGIVGELEMPLPMRLQTERAPDAMHRGLGQPHFARDLTDTPVRAVFG